MREVRDWMIAAKLAKNDFNAAAIVNGLRLHELPDDDARKARVMLYRKWKPKTDPKNELPTQQAFELAIAGIDPADVEPRQIELPEVYNSVHTKLVKS